MQTYMRICPICAKEDKRESYHSKIYVPGWIDYYIDEASAEGTSCGEHPNQKLIKSLITCEEFQILRKVSNDPSFVQAMDELKAKDIIEFNLKMAQFKSQVSQQKSTEQENDVLRCPNCNSTNIKSISGLSRGASIAMLGIFSKKINKSFECKNCGYTW